MDILLFVLFLLFLFIYVLCRLVKILKGFSLLFVIEAVWIILGVKYVDWALAGGRAVKIHLYISIALLVLGMIYAIAIPIFFLLSAAKVNKEAKEKRLPGETLAQAVERIDKEHNEVIWSKIQGIFTSENNRHGGL